MDFQLRSLVDPKPVELREIYIPLKLASLFDCKNKIGSIKKYHAWGIGYIFPQCTDTSNFICAIKQGGLGLTVEVYNSLLAQLA